MVIKLHKSAYFLIHPIDVAIVVFLIFATANPVNAQTNKEFDQFLRLAQEQTAYDGASIHNRLSEHYVFEQYPSGETIAFFRLELPNGRAADTITVIRYQSEKDRWKFNSFLPRWERKAVAEVLSTRPQKVFRNSGYYFLRGRLNPSAGVLYVLDLDLNFRHAFGVGSVFNLGSGRLIVYEEFIRHFGGRPYSVALYDPELQRNIRIFPMKPPNEQVPEVLAENFDNHDRVFKTHKAMLDAAQLLSSDTWTYNDKRMARSRYITGSKIHSTGETLYLKVLFNLNPIIKVRRQLLPRTYEAVQLFGKEDNSSSKFIRIAQKELASLPESSKHNSIPQLFQRYPELKQWINRPEQVGELSKKTIAQQLIRALNGPKNTNIEGYVESFYRMGIPQTLESPVSVSLVSYFPEQFTGNQRYSTVDLNEAIVKVSEQLNLEKYFNDLQNAMSDTMLEEFKRTPEGELNRYHFSLGRWIRNNMGLWQSSDLKEYFMKRGIDHPDSMSMILLAAFHRRLNKKTIKFQELINRAD